MAIGDWTTQNITTGWHGPPQLSAANIGGLVEAILRNKLARERDFQGNIAETIKNVRSERQSDEYLKAMKAAGLISQDYEAGGVGGATLGTGLAKMIQNQTETENLERHRRAMEGFEGERIDIARQRPTGRTGAPRYPYTIPGTDETVDLPGEAYARRRSEDVTTGSYQGLLKSEADARAQIQELETKWGGAPKGQLKGAPAWPWQEDTTKGERTKDQILYNRARQQLQMNQTQRENLEKRKPGIVGGAPAAPDTGAVETDVEVDDTTKEPALSPQDREAFEWAQANPDDPRAKAILARLGIR